MGGVVVQLAFGCVVAIITQRLILRWLEGKAARAGYCAENGHRMAPVFLAMGQRQFPTQQCERCGYQENHIRCLACGKTVKREYPHEIVECNTQDDRRAG